MISEVEVDVAEEIQGVNYADVPEQLKPLMEKGEDIIFALRRYQNDLLSLLKQSLRNQVEADLGNAFKIVSEFVYIDFDEVKDRDCSPKIKAPGLTTISMLYRYEAADDARHNGKWRIIDLDTNAIATKGQRHVFSVSNGKDFILAHTLEEALFLAREAHVRQAVASSAAERAARLESENEERISSPTSGEKLLACLDAYVLSRFPV